MEFKRILDLKRFGAVEHEYYGTSAFLFGPRMTGKTSLLKKLSSPLFLDLLKPTEERRYRGEPEVFWQELKALPQPALVIIDEVQRVPELLDYVQASMAEHRHWFLLSGSSARKLRRGGANLLGGRALDLKLHPLTRSELAKDFDLPLALHYGTLPRISELVLAKKLRVARDTLKAYVTTYIQQEIKAESLARDLSGFERFLAIAAASHGQMIEFATIGRECSVKAHHVKEFYSILEDTLIGRFLWPLDKSARKKSRPKFYFFDAGVLRALQNRLADPPTPMEIGFLFEGWFVEELHRLKDYFDLEWELSVWRHQKDEVDLVISKSGSPRLAFEIKSGRKKPKLSSLRKFAQSFPDCEVFVVGRNVERPRDLGQGVLLISWEEALGRFRDI
jgi:uncharacterized protein